LFTRVQLHNLPWFCIHWQKTPRYIILKLFKSIKWSKANNTPALLKKFNFVLSVKTKHSTNARTCLLFGRMIYVFNHWFEENSLFLNHINKFQVMMRSPKKFHVPSFHRLDVFSAFGRKAKKAPSITIPILARVYWWHVENSNIQIKTNRFWNPTEKNANCHQWPLLDWRKN